MGIPIVARVSACYSSGYPPSQQMTFEPANGSNPETVQESPPNEDFRWKHDATPSLFESELLPFQAVFPEEDGYIKIGASGTGLQVALCFVPVSPAWAASVIADKSLTQNGTWGNWDKYDLADGDPYIKVECDGVSYELSSALHDQGSYVLLWTANNDLYASVYINMINSADHTAIIAKLVATNPDLWATNGFKVTYDVYT